MHNKYFLLIKKPNSNKLFHIILSLIIIILIITSYSYKTYDTKNIVGIYKCEEYCYIETSISYEDINKIDKSSIIEYKNNNYKIEDILYSEPYLNNNIAYQDINIKCCLKEKDKIVKVKILYNKQRILKKIITTLLKED